jgi:flagellar protein FlbD
VNVVIQLTRLNGEVLYLNCELIELIEATPDSVIKLTTGNKLVVQEAVDDIIQRVITYKREIFQFGTKEI